MLCHQCLLLSRADIVTNDGDGNPIYTMGTATIGPAVAILNGVGLCLRHWMADTEPQ